MKKFFLLCAFLMSSVCVWSKVLVDDLYYNLDIDNKTAEVTYQTHYTANQSNPNSYYVSGNITIPSSIVYNNETYMVVKIGDHAFYNCYNLKSVTIPPTITTIGNTSFRYCSGLNIFNIQDIEAWCNIDFHDYPTYYSKSLYLNDKEITELIIPETVTNIKDKTFAYLSNLKSVTIPNSVTEIGDRSFYGCNSLSSIEIGYSVNSIGKDAFTDCPIEDLKFNCKNIISWFRDFKSIKKVTIGSSVISINDYAFSGCSGLTNIEISNSVTLIGDYAFSACSGLTNVTIPNSVTSIGDDAFSGCSGLMSVTIGNSVTSIGKYAFRGCSGLTSVTIPNSVTSIGNSAFNGCSALKNIVFEDGEKGLSLGYNYLSSSSGKGLFYDCPLDKIYLGRTISYATYPSGGYSPFYDNTTLKEVTIGNSVTSIGEYAFRGCSGLRNVTIPNSVTLIGNDAFSGCSGLMSVTIGNSVTSIGDDVFSGCSGLNSITIGNSVTLIGDNAFSGCSGLNSITIPNSVTSIGNSSFCGCSALKELIFEDGDKAISLGYNKYSSENDGLFSNCPLEKLYLGRNITNSYSISYYRPPFYNQTKLNDMTIGDNVTTLFAYFFYKCSGLTNVTIPNSVSSIGDYAFYGCSGLTSISVPSSVTSIGDYAFKDCKNLKWERLVIKPEMTIGYRAFDGCTIEQFIYLRNDLNNSIVSGMKGNIYVLNKYFPNNILSESIYPIISIDTESSHSSISFNKCISTLIDVKIPDLLYIDEEIYDCSGNPFTINGLHSGTDYQVGFSFNFNGKSYDDLIVAHTKDIEINIYPEEIYPTSVSLSCDYETGDAIEDIIREYWQDGESSQNLNIIGLKPSLNYNFKYSLVLSDGRTLIQNYEVTTPSLKIKTLKPKCPTNSTAIVAAETNMSDEEMNAGFQWKKYDAPSSLDPNEGYAIVYEGMLEGQINNLQSTSFYNVRAFYKSSTGSYYYGDWVTFDPSDFSYFDPTVRTYSSPEINGNSAKLKGYAMPGTDNIISQGFQYWIDERDIMSVLSTNDTQTINVDGQLMLATINELPAGNYNYRAFVQTEKGYYYGEEQNFEIDMSGVENVVVTVNEPEILGYYDLNGRRYEKPCQGLNIILFSDGTTKKILLK